MILYLSKRQKDILDLVQLAGDVSVDKLAVDFNVSPQTIRMDLRELDNANKLVRTHGGARTKDGKQNLEYQSRKQLASKEKIAIGLAAAKLIPNNSSLFINIGTTTEAVSDALKLHTGLLIITNNINVASNLSLGEHNEVVVAGGSVRTSDGGIVGEATVDFINQFRVDFAIIGSSAIATDGTLLDFDYREVKVSQAILSNARHIILVADTTKIDRKAHVRIGHISQIDTFVTDKLESQDIRDLCDASGVKIVEATRG